MGGCGGGTRRRCTLRRRVGEADVIVVGAGTAGCLLAQRLAEGTPARVMLIEAGADRDDRRSRIPAAFPAAFGTDLDWAFRTEPARHLRGRRLQMPRGRGVGGSGAINAMINIAPRRADLEEWARHGGRAWGPSAMATRLAKLAPPEVLADPHPLTRAFVTAAHADGLPHREPLPCADAPATGVFAVMQRGGRRHSPRDDLEGARARPNLEIVPNVLVDRLRVADDRVQGVEVISGGHRVLYGAPRVVLCAGAIGSPTVLLRSGIGDAGELEALGIVPTASRPGVGAGLQDHPIAGVVYRVDGRTRDQAWRRLDDASAQEELARGRGVLTSNLAEAGAFLATKGEVDLQLHFSPLGYVQHGSVDLGPCVTVGATLLRPTSRGRISLASREPTTPPRIEVDYLGDPEELATLRRGIARIRSIVAQPPLRDVVREELLPGRHARTRQQLDGFLRFATELLYHPVGTCRMGRTGDEATVVGPDLAVVGIDGLWVADASVLPTIPAANTHVATALVAQLAAERLLEALGSA